ncbi:PASTA domain-containing protein [Amycolatopsis mediterranei]|uniref:PASTA domain-containing protein n=3 Tax=Amycolatopsis mediterranei TaxID=33910 RepID=UPI0009B61F4F
MDLITKLSPIVGLLALGFAIFVYVKNTRPKRLSYTTVADQDIGARVHGSQWGTLSVRFDDQDLSDPRILMIEVRNSGKVEIRPEDFSSPIAVQCTKQDQLISARIQASGHEISPQTLDNRTVTVPGLLLNPREIILIHLLVNGRGDVLVDAHVAGASLVADKGERTSSRYTGSRRWQYLTAIIAVAMTTVIVTAFAIGIFSRNLPPIGEQILRPMPNVVSRDAADAISELNRLGFTVSQLKQVPGPGKPGSVAVEDPSAGTMAVVGQPVTLSVFK